MRLYSAQLLSHTRTDGNVTRGDYRGGTGRETRRGTAPSGVSGGSRPLIRRLRPALPAAASSWAPAKPLDELARTERSGVRAKPSVDQAAAGEPEEHVFQAAATDQRAL